MVSKRYFNWKYFSTPSTTVQCCRRQIVSNKCCRATYCVGWFVTWLSARGECLEYEWIRMINEGERIDMSVTVCANVCECVCAGVCLCEYVSIWFLMLSNLLGCFFFGVSQFSNIHSICKAEKKFCCVLLLLLFFDQYKQIN